MRWTIIWTPGWNGINKSKYCPPTQFSIFRRPCEPTSWLTFRLILCRSLRPEREGQRGELNLIAPHRTQLPLAFAFSFHCWPSALPWIWKMSSNSSAGVGWYVQQCGLCCCTLPIPPAGRRHRRRAIARKKGRVRTVVEFGHGQNSKRILTYQPYILNTNYLSALLLSFTKGMSILHLTK